MEHRSKLNIFCNIRGQFMKVQIRDSKFKGACEPVNDHLRRRIATPTLQEHLNDVKYFHRMAPTTQSRGIKYRLAAIENRLEHGVRQRYQRKVQQIPSTSQQLQSSSKRQEHQTVPTDSPNMASNGSETPDAERFAFLPRDTSTDECKCRVLRPLDRFETKLRPQGDGSMWLAIRSSRRGKTVQKVGW
ncbi:hypothetical protein TcCL_NonESM09829 [Trypanosoma cruzi]|nr:hypothetical protein TcCL_NonESM09829 [Trypanosoma cruzi]